MDPPAFLLQNIQSKLEEEDMRVIKQKFSALLSHTIEPSTREISFDTIMKRINDTDHLNAFKKLKNNEVKPPFPFERLMEIIKGLATKNNVKTGAKVISFAKFKKMTAAAAILFFVIAVYFTFQKINNFKSGQDFASNITAPSFTPIIVTPPKDANLISKTDSNFDITSKNTNKKNRFFGDSPRRFGTSLIKSAKAGERLPLSEMNINGVTFQIIDNDYLATFAALTEENLPLFLKAENPVATNITLDQYTSINISEGMSAMMKKMYKTRKSGKPTRRARKQKEKLEKWKKADVDYFNQNSNLNPLDPRDLGNFILNK